MMIIPEPRLPQKAFDPNIEIIRFRFVYTRHQGKYSAKKLKRKDRKTILNKLRDYQNMTVLQFKSSNSVHLRQYHGKLPSPPDELSPDVKDGLAQYFRITGKMRLYGYLFDQDFQIIWIDPDHKLSDKKNK